MSASGGFVRGFAAHGRFPSGVVVTLVILSTLVAGLFVAPVFPAHAAPSAAPGTSAPLSSAVIPPAPRVFAAGSVGIPPGAPNASGPGVFYTSRALPSPVLSNQACVAGNCYNISNDVSVNLTSRGVLAAAYTSLTDQSPCISMRSSSVSNIALTTSTDGGSTWSPVSYLGNPVCTGVSAGYSDSWEPTITSLANGTLALAYVEYNLTAGSLPPLSAYTWPPVESRLVLTESYDNGASWTSPQVLNISNPASAPPGLQYTPAFPSITAFGNTIYVTWMSLTIQDSFGSVALLVSSTGGASWSPTIPVSEGANYAMDPQVTTDSAGRVYIAYTSNVSQQSFFCGLEGCLDFSPSVSVGSVWVASSYSNGTIFNYSEVADSLPLGTPGWAGWSNPAAFGPFETPAPQIVASAATGNLYVAFTAGYIANGSTFGCFSGALGCLVNTPFFFTSFDNGSSWSEGNLNTVVLNPNTIDPTSRAANASDSVTSLAIATAGGSVYLEAGFYNGTICFGPGVCGAQTEVVFSTSDNGSTFTNPAIVAASYTPEPYAWTGEYDSVIVLNATPNFFWTSNVCPGYATTPCGGYPGSALPAAGIEQSTVFNGTGVTVSFTASGLPSDLPWSVDVLGNVRAGLGNQTLSVSGVPTQTPILWTVPSILAPGYEFIAPVNGTLPSSPQTLSTDLTVTVPFTEFVSVTYRYSIPNINGPACQTQSLYGSGLSTCPPSFYPGCLGPPGSYPNVIGNYTWGCFSVYFSPVPPSGPAWVRVGSVQQIGLLPMPAWACNSPWGGYFGYVDCDETNYTVSFAGWAGSGLGSISSSSPNITFRPFGPVTESATFFVTQVCQIDFEVNGGTLYTFDSSCGQFTSNLTVQENGLPTGTSWGVTLSGAAGSGEFMAASGSAVNNPAASLGLGTVTPWNVPSTVPGDVWVGSIAGGDTMVLPITGAVTVNYSLVPQSSFSVPVNVSSLGLASGMNGNVTLTNVQTSAVISLSPPRDGTTITLPAGDYVVNASVAQTTQGTDYVPAAVYADVGWVGASNQSGSVPLTVSLEGPASITVAYTPEYWVAISAALGGVASPASEWVLSGRTLTLTATAEAGYVFVGWDGSGPGATGGATAHQARVTILPLGPVSELALFEATPAPVYTVTFTEAGLPSGQTYSVTVGSSTYSGAGTFSVGNFSAGRYAVSVPDIAGFGASISRFVPVSLSASAGLSGTNLTLDGNVTVLATFVVQYFVSVEALGPGSLSLPPGGYWELAGSTLSITATPAAGAMFVEWLGSVNGGSSQVLGSLPTLSITLSGSAALVAQFGPAPPVVAKSFNLTVTEKGLPSGTAWQFVLSPGHGGSGTGNGLEIAGLNGSYHFTVPTVYVGAGIRFVAVANASANLTVNSNSTESVTFVEQFLVSISVSAAGYPSSTTQSWAAAGTPLELSAPAPPAAGFSFAGWQGSGEGSYTGTNASQSITPAGPVTETATFAQGTVSSGTAAPSTGDWAALGIIVAVLLAVGIAEGIVMGRRRRRPPAAQPTLGTGSALSEVSIPGSPPPPAATPAAAPPWSEKSTSSAPIWSEK